MCEDGRKRADCFGLNSSLDQCTFCFSGGKCLRGDLEKPDDFLCLCPKCSHGRWCEFSSFAFGFTLDSLLSTDSLAVRINYTCLTALLFVYGLFTNTCSLVTFKRPQQRKFAVCNYLLFVSVLNQCALFFLFLKFVYILGGFENPYTLNLISCKTISYLLFVFTRAAYWLTSWVTCDRLGMALFPTLATLKNSHIAFRVSAATFVGLTAMHIPDALYTTVAINKCITKFDHPLIFVYNRVNTLLHYLGPFAIQTLSITLLLVLVSRSRAKSTGGNVTFGYVLKQMFHAQKELYVTPTIIILSALPQAILSFSLACSELSTWQRHVLLFSYLFSYAPQILGFILFVSPSKAFSKELQETALGKMCLFKSIVKPEIYQRTATSKLVSLSAK